MIKVKVFEFSPVQENTYVLYNDFNKAIIIDPGCYFTAEQETLKNFIKDTQLEPVRLLNTHCHLDHVFGNRFVAETWQLEPWIHPGEEALLQLAPAMGEQWGLPFKNYEGPLHYLHEGDTVSLGEDLLEVIFAPGHSPASICFYCREQDFIIAGDVLFYESIGRTDLPGGDHETLLKNIREKLFVLPGETIVYSGHGPSTTIKHEMEHNPFL